jgi:hypothetical protein
LFAWIGVRSPRPVILVALLGSLVLLLLGAMPNSLIGRKTLGVAALVSLVFVIAATLSVFGPDDYRGFGTNWSNRPSEAHRVFGVCVTVAALVSLLFTGMAWRNPRAVGVRPALVLAGIGEFVMGWLIVLTFLSN